MTILWGKFMKIDMEFIKLNKAQSRTKFKKMEKYLYESN